MGNEKLLCFLFRNFQPLVTFFFTFGILGWYQIDSYIPSIALPLGKSETISKN